MPDEINVGDYLRFSHHHLFETVQFNCRVYKVESDGTTRRVFFTVPDRARSLPFPPFKGWARVVIPYASALPAHQAWQRRQASK